MTPFVMADALCCARSKTSVSILLIAGLPVDKLVNRHDDFGGL